MCNGEETKGDIFLDVKTSRKHKAVLASRDVVVPCRLKRLLSVQIE